MIIIIISPYKLSCGGARRLRPERDRERVKSSFKSDPSGRNSCSSSTQFRAAAQIRSRGERGLRGKTSSRFLIGGRVPSSGDAMARRSSSSSRWRYLHPAYYLKRPKRLAFLFIVFVVATFAVWDRQSLVREHEVSPGFLLPFSVLAQILDLGLGFEFFNFLGRSVFQSLYVDWIYYKQVFDGALYSLIDIFAF